MDLKESPELASFRKGVREWVLANLPDKPSNPYTHRGLEEDDYVGTWYQRLAEKKWLAAYWKAYEQQLDEAVRLLEERLE